MPTTVKAGGGKVDLPLDAEVEEFFKLRAEVQRARPRAFIERYFKIRDLRQQNVQMKFLPDQEDLYNQTFMTLDSYDDPARWFVFKPREAFSTTTWIACATAFHLCVEGFAGDIVLDSDKNLMKSALPMHTHFIDNLPSWMGLTRGFWDKDVREIIHQQVGAATGKVLASNTSTLTFSSARSKNFGRGGRPKMILLSEAGAYEQSFAQDLELSLADSLTEHSWRIDESTPKGGTVFHARFESIRDGLVAGKIIKRYWFMKPNSAYKPDSPNARPADKIETLTLTDYERGLALRFPKNDTHSIHDRIRWRRAKIAEKLAASYRNQELAESLFQQEHVEDDITPWSVIASAVLPKTRIEQLILSVRNPLEEGYLGPGLYYRVWQKQVPGNPTITGCDPARGGYAKIGDAIAAEIIDARTGIHMAELFGRPNITIFIQLLCRFLIDRYRGSLLAIERNGIGWSAVEAALREQYSPLYYKPDRQGSKAEPEPGWDTGSNKSIMHERLWTGLDNGSLTTYSAEMLQDLYKYNPNEKDHTPDRVIAFMIAQAVRIERGMALSYSLPGTQPQLEVVQVGRY